MKTKILEHGVLQPQYFSFLEPFPTSVRIEKFVELGLFENIINKLLLNILFHQK